MTENAVAAKPTPAAWWTLVKTAISSWLDDYAPSMGAALSYYTLFSLAPLLLIVVSVAGLVFGEDAVRGELFNQLQGLMGGDAAKAVQGLLASVNKPGKSVAGTVVGVALLLFGATTVFGELQDALDRIWRAPAREKGGLWSLLRARVLSFGLILGLAFLLMVSLVLGAAIAALGKLVGRGVRRLGDAAADRQPARRLRPDDARLRDDLQAHAARPRALARRLARRDRHRGAVHDRQVPDRPVHRQERRRLGLRRRRLADRDPALGLLLGADLPRRRRVHLGLCQDLRLAARRRGRRRGSEKAAAAERGADAQRRSAGQRRRRGCADRRRRRRRERTARRPARDRRARSPATSAPGSPSSLALRFIVPRLLRRL